MKTIEIKLYQFSELSESAKNKAIEKMYDINTEHDWFDFVFEDAKEIGKLIGIEIDDIYFSGFSSQGDGACFEGNYSYEKECTRKVKEYAPTDKKLHSIVERLQDLQKRNFYKLSASIKHSGRYSHEYSTEIEVFKDGNYMYSESDQKSEDELKECLRSFMKWIYKRLNDEYDYLTTKEAIIETIEANEYEFLESGKRPCF
jgi:hypothetical protein